MLLVDPGQRVVIENLSAMSRLHAYLGAFTQGVIPGCDFVGMLEGSEEVRAY